MMATKITKLQKYSILWLNHNKLSVDQIAEELNLSKKQIDTVISENTNTDKVKTKSSPVGNSPSKNLMIRETANKKSHVAIMTKESSMVNDEAKKQNTNTKSTKDIPGIYRPNGK